MFSEESPSPHVNKGESEVEARLRMDRFHVRREVKNLIDWVQQSPGLPNRDQVLRNFQDILTAVPSYSREEEEYEEHLRKTETTAE